MSNIKDNSEYWAKGLTVAVDRPTLLTESPAHTNKQYYIQAENVFVVVQAPDYIPGSDGGPEVVFANGRIGLLKNLTGDVDLEGALLVANNLSDLANTAAARTNLGLGSLAIKNSVDNNDWAGVDLSIANGGTGASDASGARSNLGLGDLATQSTVDNTDWFGDALEVANGGTGASDAVGARTNLGLGDLSTKSTINNNDWSGVDLAVSNGGTGASDAPSARTNLGLGDAATRTVQTSSTDTTAGALMAVGAFGIGGNGPFVDANSVSVTGLYNCATNAPTSGSHSLYHHEYDANTAMQLAIKGGGDQLFFRRKASDSWQPWLELVKNGDSPTFNDVSAEGNLITVNATTPTNTSSISAFQSANRHILQVRSYNTQTDGAWANFYGNNDSINPGRMLLGTNGTIPAIEIDQDNSPYTRDYNSQKRRLGWVPGNITLSGSLTATDAHVGNVLHFVGGSTATLTLPALTVSSGALIQVLNRNSGNLTIAQSGITLRWLQGGSQTTGTRTVAPLSVVTLCKLDGANWGIWGNGIS